MYNQIIIGKPKKCLNRMCRAEFFKESFVGYVPKSDGDVYCVMRCPKCKDTFAIVQPLSMIKGYVSELPSKPKPSILSKITTDEVESVKKAMEDVNILSSLGED